jgi:hypothetical protein
MNIRTNDAGYVTNEHILKSGFKLDEENTYIEMGQGSYTLTDYSKYDKLFLTGGYWTYYIKDKNGKTLFEGWWNSNDEFDETISKLEAQL